MKTRTTAAPTGSVPPDSSVTGPIGKSASPMSSPATATVNAAATPNATTPTNLTTSSRVRLTGTTSMLRRVPIEASPATASPAATDTASGRNSGSVTTSAVKATNRPLPAIAPMNAGPSAPPRPLRSGPPARRIATAMRTGTQASAPSSAMFRRRPNTSRSSERSSRNVSDGVPRAGTTTVAFRPVRAARSAVRSLVDIEALPRERDEHVLEIGALHEQLADADPGEHELAVDGLRPHVAERGDEHAVPDVGLPQPGPGQHLDRTRHVVRTGDDDAQPGGGHVPQIAQRALRDQPPAAHDADVGADLLDLRQQVRGEEHGRAFGGELPDERPDLSGALRVQAVRRLVEHEQVPGTQQRPGEAEALAHAQGVVAVPLPGGRGEADPLQRLPDPALGGTRVDGPVTGVEPGEVRPAGQVRVERRALDQRADPGQHAERAARHGAAQHVEPPRGGPDETEQHPDGRRLPRAVGPEEPEHGAVRHDEVDVVDGHLPAVETLGQPAGGERRRYPGVRCGRRGDGDRQRCRGAHRELLDALAAACSTTAGSTAPT